MRYTRNDSMELLDYDQDDLMQSEYSDDALKVDKRHLNDIERLQLVDFHLALYEMEDRESMREYSEVDFENENRLM